MNHAKQLIIAAGLVLVMLIVSGGVVGYYMVQAKKCSKDFSSQKKEYEKKLQDAQKEILALKEKSDKIQNDYVKSDQDLRAITVDRDNLIAQVKQFVEQKNRVTELENAVVDAKKQIASNDEEKGDLRDQTLLLKGQLTDLTTIQKQLIKEKEQLEEANLKLTDKSNSAKLEEENTALKTQNSELLATVKTQAPEIARLKDHESQLLDQVRQFTEQLAGMNKAYTEALRKNKVFEERVMQTPAKFAEIARQNKALIRQTANMHYNLGVFYTQHKEYTRAVAEFEKDVELTPDDPYAHFNLGYIYSEYLVNRPKAIWHFQNYLRVAKKDDKDVDWVKKYILTWQSFEGKEPLQ